jgi:hypothetical protein
MLSARHDRRRNPAPFFKFSSLGILVFVLAMLFLGVYGMWGWAVASLNTAASYRTRALYKK